MKPSFIEADMKFSIPRTKTLIRVGNEDHVGYVVVPERGAPEIVVIESGDRSADGAANPFYKAWKRMKDLGYDVEYEQPLKSS